MRNLKKILALVLAFVMSLSLMATAGAADFTDASSINEKYETAVEVLEGLGVFRGYQEGSSYSFKPTESITRAETAAIIYRIVTGDVKDEQVGIYADYNLFTDVPSTSWFAGYVNFCANAEYIKGVGGGKFDPNSRVTGYAALAMILRAIGYTANGGFTGSDWEVQTARTAESRKITKNILTGTLGQPATRESVAEILFQAILVNMVDHNILNTNNGQQGYSEIDMTLGYKTFKLEEIQGVVVANEFADLYSNQVLGNGRTNLEIAKDDIRSLAISTEITDIGESRYAYITGSEVLAMGDTGLNNVTETGAATDIDTAAKFRSTAEMNWITTGADATQFYVNFGRTGNVTCDQRLEFNVVFNSSAAENSFERYTNVDISVLAASESDWSVETIGGFNANGTVNEGTTALLIPPANLTDYETLGAYTYGVNNGTTGIRYTKIIYAGNDISDGDLDVIRGIFGAADNVNNNNWLVDGINGDVFVGTKSTNSAVTDEERDLSNTISYKKFVDDYLNPETYDVNWSSSLNGDWVKFIDNDNDGDADYAFVTHSWLDEVTGTYTNRDGETITEYYRFNEENSTVRYMDGNTPAVDDVVVCALIDGQILVEPANSVTDTVTNYNWREDRITTVNNTDGYGQSGIGNATEMQILIRNMEDRTEYIMYFDHFGYVRAYELPGGTQYALVTEIYATNNQTGNVLMDWPMTAELRVGEAESHEYSLSGGGNSQLVSRVPWTEVISVVGTQRYYNWLQPAIAHLGVTRQNNVTGGVDFRAVKGAPTFTGAWWTLWADWNQYVRVVNPADAAGLNEFNYNDYDRTRIPVDRITANTYSFTNVAVANINGETATLTGAAQLRLNNQGQVMAWPGVGGDTDGIYNAATESPRYAVDYIQLSTANVAADQVNYPVHANYTGYSNGVVNATHNTEFYIVHNGGVEYFKDYTNMPALNGDNYIYAAYAVARDTSADSATAPYWVADVIVYEVRTYNDDSRTSVALAYFNQSRTTGDVQLLKTLSNVSGGPMVDVVPTNLSWNAQGGSFNDYAGYAFYQVWNGSEVTDGQMSARRVTRIPEAGRTYASYGIYAGTVDRVTEDALNGGYIYVNQLDNLGNVVRRLSLAVNENVYAIRNDNELGGGNYNEAVSMRYTRTNLTSNQVQPGDLIIWQGGALNSSTVCSSAFIVDLGNPGAAAGTEPLTRWNRTPTFLKVNEWPAITAEQGGTTTGSTIDITFKFTSAVSGFPGKNDVTLSVPKGTAVTYNLNSAPFAIDGWAANTVTVSDADNGTVLTGGGTDYTWTASPAFTLAVLAATTDEDLTVVVDYVKATTSFQATATASTLNAANFDYKLGGDTTSRTGATTAVTTLVGGGDIPYGAAFELTVPKAQLNPLYTYDVDVTNGTHTSTNFNGDGDMVITGVIKGATTVDITETKGANLATIALDADTITPKCSVSGITNNAEVLAGEDIVFQVVEESGYEIDKVSYQVVGGTASGTLTKDANGDYVIPGADVVANSTVSIKVECVSTTAADFTIKADNTNAPTDQINYVVKDRTGALVASGIVSTTDITGKAVSVKAGYTIEFSSAALFKAKTSAVVTSPGLTTAAPGTNTADPATYTLKVTVTNATTETITLGNNSLS